jgi:uncharacterized protein
MHKDFSVVDADAHVMEPPDLWEQYIDPQFRSQAPKGYGTVSLEVLGQRMPDLTGLGERPALFATIETQMDWRESHDERYTAAARRGYDPASQIDAMDQEGVDLAVLYPTRGLFAVAVNDLPPQLVGAICRAYNHWLAEFCSYRPGRLFGAALIALHDPEVAAAEARFAVEQLGLRAIFLRPNPINGRTIDHPEHEPFYAEVERLGVPLAVHDAAAPRVAQFGRDRYDKLIKLHMMCHAVESMGACMDLILGGVFERHPRLRCAFLEASCGWVPWWLERMDEHYEKFKYMEGGALSLAPSAYFRRQCFVSAEAEERGAKAVVEALGDENLVVGTDYPHGDSSFPYAIASFVAHDALTETAKRKALWHNAVRLYGLIKESAQITSASAL